MIHDTMIRFDLKMSKHLGGVWLRMYALGV